MRKTGLVISHIDGKEKVYQYKSLQARSHIIAGLLPLRLEGKTCYYTICPDMSPPVILRKQPNLTKFVPFAIQERIIEEYWKGSKSRGANALSRKYGVTQHDIYAIIHFNKL